jgi:hypothetical protein
MAANDDISFIDLQPDNPGVGHAGARRFAVARLEKLERMGLAAAAAAATPLRSEPCEAMYIPIGYAGNAS